MAIYGLFLRAFLQLFIKTANLRRATQVFIRATRYFFLYYRYLLFFMFDLHFFR